VAFYLRVLAAAGAVDLSLEAGGQHLTDAVQQLGEVK
jgi:hypothetical protein